ncbi:beta-tubulin [Naegleria gruberi]|uniref:Beta-tubulin n=1 Tax=Naegleria gruberi TaxID=5762 RepID=D2VY59_NAEGR|nr:beta-tubulin [Naegleria gruberi]EFC38306.1 beta-tubulin [Naegleria gruberi]|eukprot:XP_002671050.1 beta-tubulin [Naegleria gruberi]
MKDIVSICIGGCGNRIGSSFWKHLMREHHLNIFTGEKIDSATSSDQLKAIAEEHCNIFLHEKEDGKFVPRVKLLESKFATFGNCGNGNSFGNGYYTDGSLLEPKIMDQVRRRIEQCDYLDGFQVFHSIIGGSGSGLGSKILTHLSDDYPSKFIGTTSVLPSEECFGGRSLSYYNSVLSVQSLLASTFVTLFDNQALEQYCRKEVKLESCGYENLNDLIAQSVCEYTSPFRFSQSLNSSYRKLATNLVTYPRLHFFSISRSQMEVNVKNGIKSTLETLTRNLFDSSNNLLTLNSQQGKYLTSNICYRGTISNISMIEECAGKIKIQNESQFSKWIHSSIHTSLCETISPVCKFNSSASMISNATFITQAFKRIRDTFKNQLKRKAYLSHFLNEGMDEMEMDEAEWNFEDLILEYEQYETVCGYEDTSSDVEDEDDE